MVNLFRDIPSHPIPSIHPTRHLGLVVPNCFKPFCSSPIHHQFITSTSSVHHQLITSSSSAHHQLIISSSSVHHQFVISSSSVYHQFNISSSSVHLKFIITSSSVHHQNIVLFYFFVLFSFSSIFSNLMSVLYNI